MLIRSTLQKSGLSSTGPRRPVWALAALLLGTTLLAVTSMSTSSGKKVAQTALTHAMATAPSPSTWFSEEMLGFHSLTKLLSREEVDVWFCSLVGSIAVGLSGIFPLLVIPIEAGAALKTEGKTHLYYCCNEGVNSLVCLGSKMILEIVLSDSKDGSRLHLLCCNLKDRMRLHTKARTHQSQHLQGQYT